MIYIYCSYSRLTGTTSSKTLVATTECAVQWGLCMKPWQAIPTLKSKLSRYTRLQNKSVLRSRGISLTVPSGVCKAIILSSKIHSKGTRTSNSSCFHSQRLLIPRQDIQPYSRLQNSTSSNESAQRSKAFGVAVFQLIALRPPAARPSNYPNITWSLQGNGPRVVPEDLEPLPY